MILARLCIAAPTRSAFFYKVFQRIAFVTCKWMNIPLSICEGIIYVFDWFNLKLTSIPIVRWTRQKDLVMNAHEEESTGVRAIVRQITKWWRQIWSIRTVGCECIQPIGTFINRRNEQIMRNRYENIFKLFNGDLTVDHIVVENFCFAHVTVDLALNGIQMKTYEITMGVGFGAKLTENTPKVGPAWPPGPLAPSPANERPLASLKPRCPPRHIDSTIFELRNDWSGARAPEL